MRTKKFLLCFSLRAGTLMILWGTLLICSWLLFDNLRGEKGSREDTTFFLVYVAILFVGELLSVFALINFPAANITYSSESKTARLLKYTADYYGLVAAIGAIFIAMGAIFLLGFTMLLESLVKKATMTTPIIFFLATFCVLFIWIAPFIHFKAVVYSFYLSILSIGNFTLPLNDVKVISHDNV